MRTATAAVSARRSRLVPATFRFPDIPIGDLPMYNQDGDENAAPASYTPFRAAIAKAEAVLFVTRSIPGGLKIAIDVASRLRGNWYG